MIGPKSLPTGRCRVAAAEQHREHRECDRHHALREIRLEELQPSTALNTEMAGVIMPSQKNSAVPASAQPMRNLRTPPRPHQPALREREQREHAG